MTARVWIGEVGPDAWPMDREPEMGQWHPLAVEQVLIAATAGQLWERASA